MKVGVVILNYKGFKNTALCVESLKKCDKDKNEIELIVVDNGSPKDEFNKLSKLRGMTLIRNEENLGYSGGNNIGIKYCLGQNKDLVLMANNDITADKYLVKSLVRASEKVGIVSPKIYFAPGFEFHKNRYKKADVGHVIWYAGGKIDWQNVLGVHIGVDEVDNGQYDKESEIEFATGACMLVKREVFERIGYLDEKYFLYLEDLDFCVRAKKAGFKILFEPAAIIWHKNASSTGGSGSKLQDYYFTKSRLLFALKFAKIRTKLAVFREIISSSNKIKRKALVDFITGRLGESILN